MGRAAEATNGENEEGQTGHRAGDVCGQRVSWVPWRQKRANVGVSIYTRIYGTGTGTRSTMFMYGGPRGILRRPAQTPLQPDDSLQHSAPRTAKNWGVGPSARRADNRGRTPVVCGGRATGEARGADPGRWCRCTAVYEVYTDRLVCVNRHRCGCKHPQGLRRARRKLCSHTGKVSAHSATLKVFTVSVSCRSVLASECQPRRLPRSHPPRTTSTSSLRASVRVSAACP